MARIKKTEVSEIYSRARQEQDAVGDKNDCAVIAIHAATGVPVEVVRRKLSELGRKVGKGTFKYRILQAIAELGFNATKVDLKQLIKLYPAPHNNLKNVTSHHPRRFPKVFETGNYIFFSSDHVWNVKDGENHDWSRNAALRVRSGYIIQPK